MKLQRYFHITSIYFYWVAHGMGTNTCISQSLFNSSNFHNGEVAELPHLIHAILYKLLNTQSVDYDLNLLNLKEYYFFGIAPLIKALGTFCLNGTWNTSR